MVCKTTIVSGTLFVLAAVVSPASAVTVGPHSKAPVATEDSLLQPAQVGYCAHWRRVCSDRWGWNTRQFYLCLKHRDCNFPF
jgi:hypothetical protein